MGTHADTTIIYLKGDGMRTRAFRLVVDYMRAIHVFTGRAGMAMTEDSPIARHAKRRGGGAFARLNDQDIDSPATTAWRHGTEYRSLIAAAARDLRKLRRS